MVAFISGYNLEKPLKRATDSGVEVDYLSDGTPLQRTLSREIYSTVPCKFKYLTLAKKNTLVSWLETNAGATVTWTIDGTAYTGNITGHSEHMVGPSYQVDFSYYARKV